MGKLVDTKEKLCVAEGCRSPSSVKGHCRLHYLTYWKEIRANARAKAEKRLDAFVNRLAERYPKDHLEKLKEGLSDETKLNEVMTELESDVEPGSETEREFIEILGRKLKLE